MSDHTKDEHAPQGEHTTGEHTRELNRREFLQLVAGLGISAAAAGWVWSAFLAYDDPAKEANAQATRLANHTTTLAHEYARQGRDWEEALRQRAKEMSLMTQLGLTSATVQPTTDTTEEEDGEEQSEAAPARAA